MRFDYSQNTTLIEDKETKISEAPNLSEVKMKSMSKNEQKEMENIR